MRNQFNHDYLSIKKILLLLFYCFLLPSLQVQAIEPSARFERISTEDGLSSNSTLSVTQDSKGFLWFGTESGLNRYDGIKFKIFKHDSKDKHSLSNNLVTKLYTDSKNRIWVGTAKGLNQYIPSTEQFKRFEKKNADYEVLSRTMIMALVEDNKGNIWVGTLDQGLFRINPNNGQVDSFKHDAENSFSLSHNFIKELYEDSLGTLWIATGAGLNKFDPNSDGFINSLNDSFGSLRLDSGIQVTEIIENRKGLLWFGTRRNGLYEYNLKTETFKQYTHQEPAINGLKSNHILSLFEAADESLWIATPDGLNIYEPKTQSFTHYQNEATNVNSLSDNEINSFFQDNQNTLWIATVGGISKYQPQAQAFNHYKHQPMNPNSLSNNIINSFAEDNQGNLWIGTDNGLNVISSNTSKIKRFLYDEPSSSGGTISIHNIVIGDQGRIWVSATSGRLYLYHPETESFEKITLPPIPLRYIGSILEDSAGILWLGTGKGVMKYNPKSRVVTHFKAKSSNFQYVENEVIFRLFEDSQGNLWMAAGTLGELLKYNGKTKKFSRYNVGGSLILSINEDKEGRLWIGTFGGLYKYQPKSDTITRINNEQNNTSIFTILIDKDDQLWMGTPNGLFLFKPTENFFKKYDFNDGLQGNVFFSGAGVVSKQGEIFIGGENGFNRFFPEDIKSNPDIPIVVLTGFRLFNQSVKVIPDTITHALNKGRTSDDSPRYSLNRSISYTEKLDLSYLDSMMTFEFSALNYLNSNKNQYAYKMEGYDKNWIPTTSKNLSATYTNLDSGDYIFRVKASNNDGLWNEEGTSINIHISPPWWKSNLALFFYLVASILSIVLFIKYRTRALSLQSKALELKVVERTQKIEQLLSLKDKNFANISHEFRTPLTLILGPITKLLNSEQTDENIKRLKMVQKNSNRLLSMIEQLLNIESFRVKSITEQKVQSFEILIRNIADAFYDHAIANNLTIKINQLENVNFKFTQDAFDKIMLNLLSNAVKYTPAGGIITVYSERTSANELMIEVKDTGIGIPVEQQKSVFDRFTRVLDNRNEQVTGSGIGLALVKEIVDIHQGRIELESKPDQGSTFRVYLPIIDEVSNEQLDSTDRSINDELLNIAQMNLSEQLLLTNSEGGRKGANNVLKFNNQTKRAIEKDNSQTSLLLVEDDSDMRQYLLDCIGNQYQIFIAKDGEQGFNIATAEVPDIIISDIMMPVMDGIEMVHQLKAQGVTSHIPVIFLTAKGDHKSRMTGLQEHANDYLTKPFNADELLLRVSNLLLIQSQLRQQFIKQLEDLKLKNKQLASYPVSIQSEVTHDVAQNGDLEPDSDKKLSTEHQFIQQLDKFINDNYQQVDLNIESLARVVFVSERQLRRKFKALLAMTPAEYLRHFRLEKAALFLSQGKKAGDVSFLVGYSSHSSFSQSFKMKYGVSPSEYVAH